MSLDMAMRQLHRMTVLHSSASVLPGGRVLTAAEGKALAQKALAEQFESRQSTFEGGDADEAFALPEDEGTAQAAARAAHSSRSTVLVEDSVSRKIVTMRQRQNKKENTHKAIEKIKADRLPEALLATELPKAQRVAEKLFNKPRAVDEKTAKEARRARLGVEKKKNQ